MYSELFIRHFATLELSVEAVQDDETHRIEVNHRPVGVVVGITRWDFPIMLACFKLAPALLLAIASF